MNAKCPLTVVEMVFLLETEQFPGPGKSIWYVTAWQADINSVVYPSKHC